MTTTPNAYQVGPNAPEGSWVGYNEHHDHWQFGLNAMGFAFTSDDEPQWTNALANGVVTCNTPATTEPTNRFGITADWPCYVPGPNAPKNIRMDVAHGASSGWNLQLGSGSWLNIRKNTERAFWQGLIDGGILVDAHGHDLPTNTAVVERVQELEHCNIELGEWLQGAIDRANGLVAMISEMDQDTARAGYGAALIATERRHAIELLGFDATHDAQHKPETLADAAVAHLLQSSHLWPFDSGFKPNLPYRRRLIIAGQFIAAAIDRLDADTP